MVYETKRAGATISSVARENEVKESTLRGWVNNKAEIVKAIERVGKM